MSMKKYKLSEEKIFSRTPTPPTGPSSRNISGSRRASKNLVRINLPSTAGELLIQPGSIDIFTCNVIPSISKFDVPCETHDGVKIAVKLPDGNRLCRRFLNNSKIGNIRSWLKYELSGNTQLNSNLTSLGEDFVLKHSAPPCLTLTDEDRTLDDCGITSNTLLVLEVLEVLAND